MMRSTRVCCASFAFALGAVACAGSEGVRSVAEVLGRYGGGGDVVAGLKEALEVGTTNAVARTSRVNGYLGDPQIRIGLPESLDGMAMALRAIGLGSQVDALEVSMNRAAEHAAAEATDIFWRGIERMTFSDAQAILGGGNTAATDYFERTTRGELRTRFHPIVDAKLSDVGVVRAYDELIGRYEALPFAEKPSFDLRSYVTEGALDGLFEVLGEEETRIRNDPAARTTALLRKVFGSQ